MAADFLIRGTSTIQAAPRHEVIVPLALAVSGTLLLLGCWTPFAAVLGLWVDIWFLITQANEKASQLQLAALALSLIMLGPGAFSVDARLFGRKRINL
jgi:putative oxidoreductase